MPATHHYTVEQTREVRIRAATPIEAGKYADAIFNNKPLESDDPAFKPYLGEVKECALVIREDN